MNTRDYFKMQSINFCYMSFMLQATKQKTVYINGTYIQDIMMDEDDAILAVMQDGEVIPAIDIDPKQSTHDIQQWIEKKSICSRESAITHGRKSMNQFSSIKGWGEAPPFL